MSESDIRLLLIDDDDIERMRVRRALKQHRAGHDHLRMAIHLSNRQFRHPSSPPLLADRPAQDDIPSAAVELELTEEIAMRNFERATAIIGELCALGVRLAIDDFGTGYSSLGRLRQFPIHTVKIDRSFIAELGDHAITETITTMTHSLRPEVIAEGVETFAQRNFLFQQGCEIMQGYFFSPPLPAAGFLSLLERHRPITG